MDTKSAPLAEWITAAERYAAALEENEAAAADGLADPYGEPALVCLRAAVVVGLRRVAEARIDLTWLQDAEPGPPRLEASA
jgi:hypothetical protein